MFATAAFFFSTELLKCMYLQLPTCSWISAQQGKQACVYRLLQWEIENLRNIHREQTKTSYEALIRLDSFPKEFLLLLLVLSISWGFVKEQLPSPPAAFVWWVKVCASSAVLSHALQSCLSIYSDPPKGVSLQGPVTVTQSSVQHSEKCKLLGYL